MAVNKVVINNETQLDLTADTVDAAHLAKGFTAHNMKGEAIVGTMESSLVTKPYMEYTLTADGKGYKTINIHGDGVTPVFYGMIDYYDTATDITISGITNIPNSFMYNLKLTENLVIGDGVEKIGQQAFVISNGAPKCNSITLSDSVKEIALESFKGWSNFETIDKRVKIIFGANLEKLQGSSFPFNYQIFDFRKATKVPVLSNSPNYKPTTKRYCTFIIPDALYDEWRVSTNWASIRTEWKKASEVTG